MKISKKLLMVKLPPPTSVIVVCPADTKVGLSRIITPPPDKFSAGISVLKTPVTLPTLLKTTIPVAVELKFACSLGPNGGSHNICENRVHNVGQINIEAIWITGMDRAWGYPQCETEWCKWPRY